jgi:hypothetical protein
LEGHYFSLAILHEEVISSTDDSLSSLGGNWLHIGSLNYSESQIRTLYFSHVEWERCLDLPLPEVASVQSVSVSVPFDGNYSWKASSSLVNGHFVTPNDSPCFDVASNESFFSSACFVGETLAVAASPATPRFTQFRGYVQAVRSRMISLCAFFMTRV